MDNTFLSIGIKRRQKERECVTSLYYDGLSLTFFAVSWVDDDHFKRERETLCDGGWRKTNHVQRPFHDQPHGITKKDREDEKLISICVQKSKIFILSAFSLPTKSRGKEKICSCPDSHNLGEKATRYGMDTLRLVLVPTLMDTLRKNVTSE